MQRYLLCIEGSWQKIIIITLKEKKELKQMGNNKMDKNNSSTTYKKTKT